ncbi:Sodium-dependent dicarboxylate transporter SdcS [bacterium HR21]|nr:Sodium-dependent dicarboxylate transporter SdcS [bacterium HR21]
MPRAPLRWWLTLSVGVLGFVASLVLPPLLAVPPGVLAVAPEQMPTVVLSIQRVLGLLWWMFWWWIGEVVPLPMTALLPALVGPLLGLVSGQTTVAEPLPLRTFLQGYVDPVVLLFLGSFLIAEALRKHGLDQWSALRVFSWRWALRSPRRLLGAVMLSTAVVSMWVSNTATAAMVMPIALGILEVLRRAGLRDDLGAFPQALVLAVAWASSIGGMVTVVGTAPNGIALGVLRQHGVELGFLEWLLFGVPVGICVLSGAWLILVWRLRLPDIPLRALREELQREYWQNKKLSPGARRVAVVFAGVVCAWIALPLLAMLSPVLKVLDLWNVALGGALLLFLLPSGARGEPLLGWDQAQRIDWGTLLLFGGGLTLSAVLTQTGAAQVLTHLLVRALDGLPPIVVAAGILLVANFSTELVSNTALASLLLPLVAASVPALGLPLEGCVIAAAMVSSCAFMLPIATPPNAIAYGTRLLPLPVMVRVGVLMNLLSTAVMTVVAVL